MTDCRRKVRPADVFVVFGITGDLAKVMTFRSLYRLEARGLLDCPIVGVAVDDWTIDQLVERARESIVGDRRDSSTRTVFDALRRAAVLRRAATSATPATYERVARRDQGRRRRPVFYLEIPPFLFGTVVKGLADAGLTKSAASSSRSRSATTATSARALGRRAAPVHRRVAALPDRPLPREDGPRRDPLPAVREHDARAGLEPQLPRVACRSRWPRTSASRTAATSTTPSARCATSSSTT